MFYSNMVTVRIVLILNDKVSFLAEHNTGFCGVSSKQSSPSLSVLWGIWTAVTFPLPHLCVISLTRPVAKETAGEGCWHES